MELKDTLLMMKTPFEMRGNLATKEPLYIKRWDEIDLYRLMNENREGAEEYLLHDGPPYANGNMHCGHMLNRLLKDFVVRYKNMRGYKTPFVFGWDTHGLPIETAVTKSGVDRKSMPIDKFRDVCDQYAHKQVEIQKGQIKRLGLAGDFDHPYLTLNKEYEARQIEVFSKMALKGLIFKGVKPVYWSPISESALAEAEVEYHDVEARTMHVGFDVEDGKGLAEKGDRILIWTTTPWTIPANRAVTAHPDFEYGLYETEKGRFIFLSELKDALVEKLSLGRAELLKSFKGREMEGMKYHHPLYPTMINPVILNTYVTAETGTGLVHTAPDHGLDDYNACMKYGIKPFCPVDEKGMMHLPEDPALDGLFYEKANDKVVDILHENGRLILEEKIVHSYPHDWRTKTPIIFRATPQWFCSISPIRQDLLDAVSKIKWIPSWGETKMVNMIKDRADWCISRQRVWGVPIPIIYNEDGSPIIEEEVFDHIRGIIKEKGSNAWFSLSAKELLPEGYSNPASPNGGFYKEKDIMDVWFDSGSSWNGVLKERGLKYPADLYLEGNDQYRGWFNASLIVSMAVNGVAPFKSCLTHGWVMDENWEKMSKSKGNGIDPSKVAGVYGADILRLWAAEVDFTSDVRLGEDIIKIISDTYRKIRNTFRFMLGNLQDGEKDYLPPEEEPELSNADRWILGRLYEVEKKAIDSYEEFAFPGVLSSITSFLSGDLSSFYLDACKDSFYCDGANSKQRKGHQYVIYRIARELCLLLNPILPFTMDEVYMNLPIADRKANPQLEDMPLPDSKDHTKDLEEYSRFKRIRDLAMKALEEARNEGMIGSSGEADLTLELSDPADLALMEKLGDEASSLLLTASVKTLAAEKEAAKVVPSKKETCPRCRRKQDLEDHEGDRLCHRCKEALGHGRE